MKHRRNLPHFEDINAHHEATGYAGRTDLPGFHVFTLEDTYPSTRRVMPPHTTGFYTLMLLEDSADAVVEVNTERFEGRTAALFFGSPGRVNAWVRGAMQRGFVVYLAPWFVEHPGALEDVFGFFRLTAVNALEISAPERARLRAHLDHLLRVFCEERAYRLEMLRALSLALLFECKGVFEAQSSASSEARPGLTLRFQRLLEQHHLSKQTVQEYAQLLHVTPNHLSVIVSGELGRSAHALIAERVALEARKLLRYTDLSVAEISDYLGFAEPTHFARFFKRQTATTPLEFRRSGEM